MGVTPDSSRSKTECSDNASAVTHLCGACGGRRRLKWRGLDTATDTRDSIIWGTANTCLTGANFYGVHIKPHNYQGAEAAGQPCFCFIPNSFSQFLLLWPLFQGRIFSRFVHRSIPGSLTNIRQLKKTETLCPLPPGP